MVMPDFSNSCALRPDRSQPRRIAAPRARARCRRSPDRTRAIAAASGVAWAEEWRAKTTLASDPRAARPAVELAGTLFGTEPWLPRRDLLGSDGDAAELVVEVEHDGTAILRFGDGVHGRRPETGTVFEATYRVGNGAAEHARVRGVLERSHPHREAGVAA